MTLFYPQHYFEVVAVVLSVLADRSLAMCRSLQRFVMEYTGLLDAVDKDLNPLTNMHTA